MSLFGALALGGSSLAAQQTALQVTGNNIANSGTPGYTRQVANLASGADVMSSSGTYVGSGVGVTSIERQVNAALNESLRDANSDQSSANSLNTQLTQLQSTFGALNSNDLSSQLNNFFNGFSTLANNPTDASQRAVVVQNGISLTQSLQNLRGQLGAQRDNVQAQVGTLATQADSLAKQIANLNSQIAVNNTGPGSTNSLLDQRDLALTQLSQIMDIRVIDQGGGNLNVLVGSQPIVDGTTTRGISTSTQSDPNNNVLITQVVFGDNGDPIKISGGQLGGLINARDNYILPAIGTVDSVASGLINAVNSIHTQGQGLTGFSTLTASTTVTNPAAALNAAATATGIAFPPKNGTFNLYMTDNVTGQTTTQQIAVNLSGTGAPTTLNSLASSISASGGGVVSASINAAGKLVIASNNGDVTFGFGEDSSGTLASLGINTFFTGTNASDIAVNNIIQNDPAKLAAGRGNIAGSNQNAQALALAGSASVSQLGGKSVTDYYTGYIGNLAAQTKTATDNATAQSTIHDTLFAQQQAVSGVSMDEEAINLTKFQRAFEGSARFISITDQMLQTVLGLIS